jgi:Flp pilus assembly protein TadG
MMISAALKNVFYRKSGSVAVSTALIAPVLILMMCGVVDLGRATYDATSLTGAVRVGAQYALRFPNDKAGIKQAVQSASTLSGTVVADPVQFCECPDGTSSSCTTSSCGTATLRRFVRVSATLPFSKIMPSSSIVVPSTLSAEAVVRGQ